VFVLTFSTKRTSMRGSLFGFVQLGSWTPKLVPQSPIGSLGEIEHERNQQKLNFTMVYGVMVS